MLPTSHLIDLELMPALNAQCQGRFARLRRVRPSARVAMVTAVAIATPAPGRTQRERVNGPLLAPGDRALRASSAFGAGPEEPRASWRHGKLRLDDGWRTNGPDLMSSGKRPRKRAADPPAAARIFRPSKLRRFVFVAASGARGGATRKFGRRRPLGTPSGRI